MWGEIQGGWLLREQPKGTQGQELGQTSLSLDAKRSAASFQQLHGNVGLGEVMPPWLRVPKLQHVAGAGSSPRHSSAAGTAGTGHNRQPP